MFSGFYHRPDRSLERYAQYAFLLTPDFFTYADMDLQRRVESVAKNRWVGYNEMLRHIQPGTIVVFGTLFPEMEGNILSVDHLSSRKAVR